VVVVVALVVLVVLVVVLLVSLVVLVVVVVALSLWVERLQTQMVETLLLGLFMPGVMVQLLAVKMGGLVAVVAITGAVVLMGTAAAADHPLPEPQPQQPQRSPGLEP